LGTYFDAVVNYYLRDDPVMAEVRKAGRNFTHLPITYSHHTMEEYYNPLMTPFKDKV
jgi:hypothetical protein